MEFEFSNLRCAPSRFTIIHDEGDYGYSYYLIEKQALWMGRGAAVVENW